MTFRHLKRREVSKRRGFCYGRDADEAGRVSYRLFRHSIEGRLFMEARTFPPGTPRSAIAFSLWQMRMRLREAVDAVDFTTLGLTA